MPVFLRPSHKLSQEDRDQIRARLDEFYRKANDYTAFQAVSNQVECWSIIADSIKKRANKSSNPIRVLEVGCGRSGFSEYLKQQNIRETVDYHAQDVTDFNEAYLRQHADSLYIGDINDIRPARGFHIIFSTYVFEHVSDPLRHLDRLWSMLETADVLPSALFIFSPRYDFPGYFPPSTRHLTFATRLRFLSIQVSAIFQAVCFGRYQFLIQSDVAAFHRNFFRDADALHWVSKYDIKAWAKAKSAHNVWYILSTGRFLGKQWLIRNYATLSVELNRAEGSH
jgi:2-polyprenyl-3-methyl-5-hydroxy-6-metoxy-1,4-benzoquinol methylase